MEENNKEITLEEKMNELKAIIAKLERDDNSLDESFKLYKEGMQYIKECNDSIDKVEKELVILENEDDLFKVVDSDELLF